MCYSVIWWSERICAIRYSAIILNITKMAFILLVSTSLNSFTRNAYLPLPFLNSSR